MKNAGSNSWGRLFSATALSLALTLTACGGGSGMDNPYESASGTSVYRVQWKGKTGTLYNMDGDKKGTIDADDMEGISPGGYFVNGYVLEGWMYYDQYSNRLYLEDSHGGVGRSINSRSAGRSSDSNWAAGASEARAEKVNMFARGLNREFALPLERARVVASALQIYHETKVERGYSTPQDVADTFKRVFGVEYTSALSALQNLQAGQPEQIRDLTNRSAAYLGIKPHQAQRFVKKMYAKTIRENGYDADSINW